MKKKGFTLIEILVVIVILVGLTVGSVLSINNIQDKSKDKKLENLYTEVEAAAEVYLTINEGYAIDLLNGKTLEKCLKLYTLQNEGLITRDLVNPYTNELLDSNTCVMLYLNKNGEIEETFDIDNEDKMHKVELEVVGGNADVSYKYGYSKVDFNLTFDENKEVKSITCINGAKGIVNDKYIIISNVYEDEKCTVNIDYIWWNVLIETLGGSASPSNSWVINNSSLNVTLSPSTGYNLSNLTESDYTCTDHNDYTLNNNILTINNVNKDVKCTVNFKDNYYIVKVNVSGGSADLSNTSVKHGGSKTFTITPSTGYTLSGATTTCGVLSSNKLTISNVTSNTECTVNLPLQSFSLSLSKGTGVSNIYYKIDNGSYTSYTGSVNVKYGSTYSYYGVASTGYTMSKCTETDPCTGTMGTSSVTDTLVASINKYKLNLSKGTGVGYIYYKVNDSGSYESTSNSSIGLDVNYNSTYYYYGTPSTGYTMNSCTSSSPCSGTMGTSAVSKALSATLNKYTLTLTKGTGVGTIYYKINGASSYTSATSTQNLSVNYGSTYYYYGVASTGYTLSTCTSSSPCSGTMGTSAVSKTLSGSVGYYTLYISKDSGVKRIYYKINGASSYTYTTSSSVSLSVQYGTTYYYYGTAKTNYSMDSCSSTCSGIMGTGASKSLSSSYSGSSSGGSSGGTCSASSYSCIVTGNPACRTCASTSCSDITGSSSLSGASINIGSYSNGWTYVSSSNVGICGCYIANYNGSKLYSC